MSRKLNAKKKRLELPLDFTREVEHFVHVPHRAKSYPEELLRESLIKLDLKSQYKRRDENLDEVPDDQIPYLHNKRLKSCGQFQNALVTLAIREGDNIQLWRLLSRKDVNINYKDGLGMQPIHYACIYGDIEILKTLLQHTVNINSPTTQGDCPLDIAVREGNFEIAQYLICKGARVKSIVNGMKDSPLLKQRPVSYSEGLSLKRDVKLRNLSYEI